MKRIDQWLLDLNMAPSRTKAKELVMSGVVQILRNGSWEVIHSASERLKELTTNDVRLKNTELLKYVARSGLKLEGALQSMSLTVKGMQCLDVGQSTGGFTDCLLKAGAAKVVGLDVGSGQLAPELRADSRVEFYEGMNAKEISSYEIYEQYQNAFELVVIDVSFISVKKIFPPLMALIQEGGNALVLIKPQFELGADALNKKGVVQDQAAIDRLQPEMIQHFTSYGLKQVKYFPSRLPGRDGNQEFFIYAKK